MSDVSVIGLGAMGSAIANALVAGSHAVTVWNRSPDKMLPFAEAGVICATSAAEAVAAAPVIVICIDDYAATRALFEQHELADRIEDRTLVQFSTGTPQEARDAEHWAQKKNAQYLDGVVLAYPREIGQDGIVAISGSQQSFDKIEKLLDALSSDIRYLGTTVGAAAALEVALLSYYVCTHLGLIHAALVCESEDVRTDLLASVIADSLPSDTEEIRNLGRVLQESDFENPGASIGVYSGVLDRILEQARDASINAEIAEFANVIYKRGIDAGFANQEVVALIKLLRKT